jgi:hypothetical protein
MTILTIKYPGGTGGRWLSNLIFCLENNVPQVGTTNQEKNFHKHLRTQNVKFLHTTEDRCEVFSGRAVFNIYLNWLVKLLYPEKKIDLLPIQEQFEQLASFASTNLFLLEERVDLDFNLIFTEPDQFTQTLFDILDRYNLVYTKNIEIVTAALQNYKDSCVDPVQHFDNYDSMFWLGWCNGISKHLWKQWPLVDSKQQMQEFLLPKREFYRDFTKDLMVTVK